MSPPKVQALSNRNIALGEPTKPPCLWVGATANIQDQQLQQIKQKMKKQSLIAEQNRSKRMQKNLNQLASQFETELKTGKMEIEKKGDDLILRISENTVFPNKEAKLSRKFSAMLDKLSDSMQDIHGDIVVAGHSDDKIIKTPQFKSNWEFSAARANHLAQALIKRGGVNPQRITVQFHGPTKPLVKNNSNLNRRRNRRIELIIKP